MEKISQDWNFTLSMIDPLTSEIEIEANMPWNKTKRCFGIVLYS
jgi:hypothetical protein